MSNTKEPAIGDSNVTADTVAEADDDAPVKIKLHRAADSNTQQKKIEETVDESVERFSRRRPLDAIPLLGAHPNHNQLLKHFSLEEYVSKSHKCAPDAQGVVRTITPTRIPLQMAYIPPHKRVHVAGDVYIESDKHPRYFIKNMMPGSSILPSEEYLEELGDAATEEDDRAVLMLSVIAPKPEFVPPDLHVGLEITDEALRRQLAQITDKQPRYMRANALVLDEVTAQLLNTTRWDLVVGYHPKFPEMFPAEKAFIYKDNVRVHPLIYGVVCRDIESCSTTKLTRDDISAIRAQRIAHLVTAESFRRQIEAMLKVVSEAAVLEEEEDGNEDNEKADAETGDSETSTGGMKKARRTLFATMGWNNFSDAIDTLCEQFCDKPEQFAEEFTRNVERAYETREKDREMTTADVRAERKRTDSELSTLQKEVEMEEAELKKQEQEREKPKQKGKQKELSEEEAAKKLTSLIDGAETNARAMAENAEKKKRELQHTVAETTLQPMDPSSISNPAQLASTKREQPKDNTAAATTTMALGDVDF